VTSPGEAFAAGGLAAMRAAAGPGLIVTHAPGRAPGEDGLVSQEELEALREPPRDQEVRAWAARSVPGPSTAGDDSELPDWMR
jgi:hypothetical protein